LDEQLILNQITIKRRVDDKLWKQQVVIHLLKPVIGHNQSTPEQNLEVMDKLLPSWMKTSDWL
jgi:hypothetical protein